MAKSFLRKIRAARRAAELESELGDAELTVLFALGLKPGEDVVETARRLGVSGRKASPALAELRERGLIALDKGEPGEASASITDAGRRVLADTLMALEVEGFDADLWSFADLMALRRESRTAARS